MISAILARGAACESPCRAIHPENRQSRFEGRRPSLPRRQPCRCFSVAVAFLCAPCVSAVNLLSFSDFPPPFLCDLCVKSLAFPSINVRHAFLTSRRTPRQKIRKHKPLPLHNLAHTHSQLRPKHRPPASKSMKLPILSARIHPHRQIRQQSRIKSPPSKIAPQLPRIHASQITRKPTRNHRLRQSPRLDPPQRKHRSHPTSRQLRFPISPHILQKKIPEDHVPHSLARSPRHRLTHRALINLIRARRRNANRHQRQSRRRSLHLQ